MENKKRKLPVFVIYSQRAAGYLMQSGFKLVDMHPSTVNPSKNVFIFFDTPEMQKALCQWQLWQAKNKEK